MITPIISRRYKKTTRGTADKTVLCEKCAHSFQYTASRSGEGQGESLYFLDNAGAADRAASRARESLEHRLREAVDVVACPECRWVQADMVRELRRRKSANWLWIALGLPAPLLLFAWIGYLFGTRAFSRDLDPNFVWPMTLMCSGAGLFFLMGILGRQLQLRRVDPNRNWTPVSPIKVAPPEVQAIPLAYSNQPSPTPPSPPARKGSIAMFIGMGWLLVAAASLPFESQIPDLLGRRLAEIYGMVVLGGGVFIGMPMLLLGYKFWSSVKR